MTLATWRNLRPLERNLDFEDLNARMGFTNLIPLAANPLKYCKQSLVVLNARSRYVCGPDSDALSCCYEY
jgi:hypothetical protein